MTGAADKDMKRKREKTTTTPGRKKGRPRKKCIKGDTNNDAKSSCIGTDYNDEETSTSENSMRRLNWQKGRQDWPRPSKMQKEIDKVTVDTLAEVDVCMRKFGWAILCDLTEVFAPSARFTREQQNYIHKSKYALYMLLSPNVLDL